MAGSGYMEERKSAYQNQFKVVSINTEGSTRSIEVKLPKMPFTDEPLTITFTMEEKAFTTMEEKVRGSDFSRMFNDGITIQITPDGFLNNYIQHMKPFIDKCTLAKLASDFNDLWANRLPIFNAEGEFNKRTKDILFTDTDNADEVNNAILKYMQLITTIARALMLTMISNPTFLNKKTDILNVLEDNREFYLHDAFFMPIGTAIDQVAASNPNENVGVCFTALLGKLITFQGAAYDSLRKSLHSLKSKYELLSNNKKDTVLLGIMEIGHVAFNRYFENICIDPSSALALVNIANDVLDVQESDEIYAIGLDFMKRSFTMYQENNGNLSDSIQEKLILQQQIYRALIKQPVDVMLLTLPYILSDEATIDEIKAFANHLNNPNLLTAKKVGDIKHKVSMRYKAEEKDTPERIVVPMSHTFMVHYLALMHPDLRPDSEIVTYSAENLKQVFDDFTLFNKLTEKVERQSQNGSLDKKDTLIAKEASALKFTTKQKSDYDQLAKDIRERERFSISGEQFKGIDLFNRAVKSREEKNEDGLTAEDCQLVLMARNYVSDKVLQGGVIDTWMEMSHVLANNMGITINQSTNATASYKVVKQNDKIEIELDEDWGMQDRWFDDDERMREQFQGDDQKYVLELGKIHVKQKFVITSLGNGAYQLAFDSDHSSVTVSKFCWERLLIRAHVYLDKLLVGQEKNHIKYLELVPYLKDEKFRRDFILAVKLLDKTEANNIKTFISKSYPEIYKTYIFDSDLVDQLAADSLEGIVSRYGQDSEIAQAIITVSLRNKNLEEKNQKAMVKNFIILEAFLDCYDSLSPVNFESSVSSLIKKLQNKNDENRAELQDKKKTEERSALTLDSEKNQKIIDILNPNFIKQMKDNLALIRALFINVYCNNMSSLDNNLIFIKFFKVVENLVKNPTDLISIKFYKQWCEENKDSISRLAWLKNLKQQIDNKLVLSMESLAIADEFRLSIETLLKITDNKLAKPLIEMVRKFIYNEESLYTRTDEAQRLIEIINIAQQISLLKDVDGLGEFYKKCKILFQGFFNIQTTPPISEMLKKIHAHHLDIKTISALKNVIIQANSLDGLVSDILELFDQQVTQLPLEESEDQAMFTQSKKLAILILDLQNDKDIENEYDECCKMLKMLSEKKSGDVESKDKTSSLEVNILIAKFLLVYKDIKTRYQEIQKSVVNNKIDSKVIDKVLPIDKNLIIPEGLPPEMTDHLKKLRSKLSDNINSALLRPREPRFSDICASNAASYVENIQKMLARQTYSFAELSESDMTDATKESLCLYPGQSRATTIAEMTAKDLLTKDGEFHFHGTTIVGKGNGNALQQDATLKTTLAWGQDFVVLDIQKQEQAFQASVDELQKTIQSQNVSGGSTLCATVAWVDEVKDQKEAKKILHLRCMSLGDSAAYVIIYDKEGNVSADSRRINTNLHDEAFELKGVNISLSKSLGDDQLFGESKVGDYHKGEFFEHDIPLGPDESFVIVTGCDGLTEHLKQREANERKASSNVEPLPDKQTSAKKRRAQEVEEIGRCVVENKDKGLDDLGLSLVKMAYSQGSTDNISGVSAKDTEFDDGKVKFFVVGDGHHKGGELVSELIVKDISSKLYKATTALKAQPLEEMKDAVRSPKAPVVAVSEHEPGFFTKQWNRFKTASRFDKFLIIFGVTLALAAIGTGIAAAVGVPVLAGLGIGAGWVGSELVAGASATSVFLGGPVLAVKAVVAVKIGAGLISAILAFPCIMRMAKAWNDHIFKRPVPLAALPRKDVVPLDHNEQSSSVSGRARSLSSSAIIPFGTSPHSEGGSLSGSEMPSKAPTSPGTTVTPSAESPSPKKKGR